MKEAVKAIEEKEMKWKPVSINGYLELKKADKVAETEENEINEIENIIEIMKLISVIERKKISIMSMQKWEEEATIKWAIYVSCWLAEAILQCMSVHARRLKCLRRPVSGEMRLKEAERGEASSLTWPMHWPVLKRLKY